MEVIFIHSKIDSFLIVLTFDKINSVSLKHYFKGQVLHENFVENRAFFSLNDLTQNVRTTFECANIILICVTFVEKHMKSYEYIFSRHQMVE